ncbi:MAG: class I SAM-dependent methyltransferase [Nanoarchaeota archaeon]|nr:class I SAM-dependent methyltransferase [Nanoarchaeota archaeon]
MKIRLGNPFTEEKIADVYSRYSHRYHAYQEAFEAFTRLVPLESRVLEIGVGTGAFTELLLSVGYDVKGIDRSEEMLRRASEQVRVLSRNCDLLDYDYSGKYNVVVSHSGGFTFKRGKFEIYYQKKEDLEQALQKVHSVLVDEGRFLVNKGEHDNEIDLENGAILTIKQEEAENSRIYTYTFQQGDREITRQQRRLALSPEELQEMSSHYFNWNFDDERWIIGERIPKFLEIMQVSEDDP